VRIHYVTHPEVQILPDVPMATWTLSEQGTQRARGLAKRVSALAIRGPVFTSPEVKAEQTAQILADALDVGVELTPGLAEIDRSATGFLPEPDFWATYHDFLSSPAVSARGWETAVEAQRRVVKTVDALLAESDSDLLLVSHGGVGALLLAQVTGVPIQRVNDQPQQGCYFRFRVDGQPVADGTLEQGWQPYESFPDVVAGFSS
jgi:broad specificity phosphatase PhoE